MKKILMLPITFVAFFFILSLTSEAVIAEEVKRSTTPSIGVKSENPDHGTSDTGVFTTQSTKHLKSWRTTITRVSGNNIRVSGITESYSTMNTIGVDLFLQVWDEGQNTWRDTHTFGSFFSRNTNYFSTIQQHTVQSGNYYRVRGVHHGNRNGDNDRVTSYTSYIRID